MTAMLPLRHLSSILSLSRTVSAECLRPFSEWPQKTNCFVWTAYLHARLLSSLHSQANFDLTDLTCPHTWYPLARKKKRNVVLHVGPTNSGKTYQALKKLALSSSGVYCGPLRLLAWEVAERLNKANVPCSLITGQEREEIAGAEHRAMTVEMADVTREYKCGVIDEIQKEVESKGKHLCSVVYGSLPPETRTRQAKMFNDASSEFDVLVASDAVGMGLNLNIRRIIFSTLLKFDGVEMRNLKVPEIKQIAGRAGRYGSKFPNGEVTCISSDDLPLLHSSLNAPSPCLEAAGLFPSFDLLALYSRLHPNCTFYSVLEHFVENAKLSSNYFISNCDDIMKVADFIEDLPLGLEERYLFCISPVDMDDSISAKGLVQFAEEYAKKGLVKLEKVFTPATVSIPKTHRELKELESIHKVLDLYIWLSFHLEESFPDRELASSQKEVCGMIIEEYLERLGYRKPNIKKGSKKSSISAKAS